ncbi:MAG: TIGR02757 family protein [Flavobacteriales bacterium]
MKHSELKELLDAKVVQYNTPDFIADDPISIPHSYKKKEDIEIAGFLVSVFAWGQRKTILKNGFRLMELMDNDPHEFIVSHGKSDLKTVKKFVHRTFNGDDCAFFLQRLQVMYKDEGGLENFFASVYEGNMQEALSGFKAGFFDGSHPSRTEKHLPDPLKGASAKRINMYLRWMIRKDNAGVDFGIWKKMKAADLYCPLDVHTGNVARHLTLLKRTQNDWQAVEELNAVLKSFDPEDPVKYDFALFGIGVNGEI